MKRKTVNDEKFPAIRRELTGRRIVGNEGAFIGSDELLPCALSLFFYWPN